MNTIDPFEASIPIVTTCIIVLACIEPAYFLIDVLLLKKYFICSTEVVLLLTIRITHGYMIITFFSYFFR